MTRKIYVSWIIAWLSIGVIVGIALSRYHSDFAYAGWLFFGLSLAVLCLVIRRRYVLAIVIMAGLFVGLSRGGLSHVELQAYQPYLGAEATLSGTVSEDTALSSDGEQRIKLKNVQIDEHELPGEVWLSTPSSAVMKRSDSMTVTGALSPGFGNFAAAMYRAELVEVKRIENVDIARDVRDRFADAVRSVIGDPQSSLGIGYLTGQRTALPEDLNENLRILGLTHIVVASGYNLTILVRFSRRLFSRVSKYLSVLTGFLLVFSFILVTGLSPSMTRAGLVTGLCLIAWYFGRTIHPFILLCFAAGLTALINPSYVWGDLGWYLSFAAFGGVLILAPLIIHYFWGENRPNSLMQIVVETSSAQLMTMPIIALAFGQYAPLAIVSNLLILPFVPFAMIATFLAGISSLSFGASGKWLAQPAELILGYMTSIVEYLATVPIAIAEVDYSSAWLIASYALIATFALFLFRRTRHNFANDSIIE
jgi:competence protein ComEC